MGYFVAFIISSYINSNPSPVLFTSPLSSTPNNEIASDIESFTYKESSFENSIELFSLPFVIFTLLAEEKSTLSSIGKYSDGKNAFIEYPFPFSLADTVLLFRYQDLLIQSIFCCKKVGFGVLHRPVVSLP